MNLTGCYTLLMSGSLLLTTMICRGESPPVSAANDQSPQAPVVQRFSCTGAGCPPPEELQRQLGGCAPSVRLENSRIDIEVTVEGGIRRDEREANCDQPGIGGIISGR